MFNNMVLSKDDVNVIHIPCGKLPRGRAEEYCLSIINRLKNDHPEYKIIFFALYDDQIDMVKRYELQVNSSGGELAIEYIERDMTITTIEKE